MRLEVKKTYKLFIGGKFPRSESGRSYQVSDHHGNLVANVTMASRKDVRDAVVSARLAQQGWAGASAYNRSQVLYRIAEMLESRKEQFAGEIRLLTGKSVRSADEEVELAIDSWVWHAGFADKIQSVAGTINPVSGPFFNISTIQPTGVVGALAPQDSALLGFVNTLAPAIVAGNAVVAITSEKLALPGLSFAEVLATSDLPAGVVNILAGKVTELSPWLVTHKEVNAIDLEGATNSAEMEKLAAETIKRVIKCGTYKRELATGNLQHILDLMEVKTTWHPKGH